MAKYDVSIFVGRFQGLHNSHLAGIRYGLKVADRLIIILGSCFQPRTPKNPWTAEERQEMILACLTEEERTRISFIKQRNYLYNDNIWVEGLQQKVLKMTQENQKVVLIGRKKDASSYYLDLFPQWTFEPSPEEPGPVLNATDVRDIYFKSSDLFKSLNGENGIRLDKLNDMVPTQVFSILSEWTKTETYSELVRECSYFYKYKSSWASAPYQPTFVTVDNVIIRSGHVLMIERKIHPGKGLYALPGGFIDSKETIKESALRELEEETKFPMHLLENLTPDQKVFDHPDRSMRGRTITHAFCWNLKHGHLPVVKGGDDAKVAIWIPIAELSIISDKIFEDHFDIASYFCNRF